VDIAHCVQMAIGDKVVIIHVTMAAKLKHASKTTVIVVNAKLDIGGTNARNHVIQVVMRPVARQLVIVLAKKATMGIHV